MPYIESTMDEFLEVANESLMVKKRSVTELLANAEKKLNKQLKTVGDCDDQLLIINNEGRKFNECIRALSKVKKDFDQGKLDKKQFSEQVKAANYLLKKNCKALQMQLGNIVDDSKAVTTAELEDFKAYINGLKKIVKARKTILAKAPAKESLLDDFDRVLEGELTLADLEAEEDEKLKKKKSDDKDDTDSDKKDTDKSDSKDDKKSDDKSEDDFDGESLDDDDDKKKDKKDKDDKEESDDKEDDKKSDDDKDDSDDDKDKDDSDKEDEDDKSDSKDDKDDDKSDKKSDDKEDSDDKDKEDDKEDKKDKSEDDDDFDLNDLDFNDDDDKKDKKKDDKKSDDKDKEDDKDAKESVLMEETIDIMTTYGIDYDEALEIAQDLNEDHTEDSAALEAYDIMSTYGIDYDEALEIASELNDEPAMEYGGFGQLMGGYLYGNAQYNIDPEEYNKNYAAHIENMLMTYNALPEGSSRAGYGEKIAKAIKSPVEAAILQKYHVWEKIPEDLKVYYNAKVQKLAAKAGAKYEKKQAKLASKKGDRVASNAEKPNPKNREKYESYKNFASKNGYSTPEEMYIAFKKKGVYIKND